MAHYESDWGRNRRSSYQFNDDESRQFEDRNFGNERYGNADRGSRENYGSRYDNEYNRGNQGKDTWRNERDRGEFENYDRYRGENDYNRGRTGNSTGVNRGSSNYLGGDDTKYENRRYPGSNYGNYNRNRNSADYDTRYNENDRDWWDKTKDEVSSWFGDDDAARRRRMDEIRGEHKGKGPKGYTRSDERIREDVSDRLSDDEHIDASDIEVAVENGEVTLTGSVENRWAKRHAEDLAESISGVKNVENRLRVKQNQQQNSPNVVNDKGSYGVAYGSSGAAPVGAFDVSKS